MAKRMVLAAVMIMSLLGSKAKADCNVIANGSFEDDGAIYDITVQEPNGWDVNFPEDEFGYPKIGGWVDKDYPTDANYNLTLFTYPSAHDVNEMIKVSQQVYLTNVDEIDFDLQLNAYNGAWDANKCTAVLLIGEDEVWQSDSVRKEYFDERYYVSEIYKDENRHTLALALRVNVGQPLEDFYMAHWDSVKGSGFLPADFDRDCHVDMNDLEMLAEKWVDKVHPNDRRNLFGEDDIDPNGIINLLDFAFYAESWDGNTSDLEMLTEKWLGKVDPNDRHNLFRDDDVEPNGVLNFLDFTIFADTWPKP